MTNMKRQGHSLRTVKPPSVLTVSVAVPDLQDFACEMLGQLSGSSEGRCRIALCDTESLSK